MGTRRLGFMFAGQGAQAVGMGADLAAAVPQAAELFRQADQALGQEVSRLCFAGPLAALTESRNCQPAIYTMSLACVVALRQTFNVEPVVCGGLSLGEFAALTTAGALEFESGLRLVAARGAFMQDACRETSGAMAAVLNAEPKLVAEVAAAHGIDIANLNCPGQIVISGEKRQLDQAVAALNQAGVSRIVVLQVDGAFHSRLMTGAAQRFAPVLAATPIHEPRCPVAQNAVGALVIDPDHLRCNLAAQVTGTVRWQECVQAMLSVGVEAMVELGPGRALSGFMRRIEPGLPTFSVGTVADLEKAVAALG